MKKSLVLLVSILFGISASDNELHQSEINLIARIADYLNVNSAQPALRNLMETFSAHCRFILTCNYVEKIIEPIQSRCQTYKIIPPSKKDVAVHVKHILEEENIKFDLDDLALFDCKSRASISDMPPLCNL